MTAYAARNGYILNDIDGVFFKDLSRIYSTKYLRTLIPRPQPDDADLVNALAETRERLAEVLGRVDAAYDRCVKVAERAGSPEIAAKIAEEKSWDGLECCCGGGWKVGHLDGCPEGEARAALTGDA